MEIGCVLVEVDLHAGALGLHRSQLFSPMHASPQNGKYAVIGQSQVKNATPGSTILDSTR